MSLERLIQDLGLPGIVVGTVAEGDTVAFLGGVLAHREILPFFGVVLAAALGAMLIDNVMFLVGRHAGHRVFVQKQLSRRSVSALRARIEGHPVTTILGFRFIYGMKTVGAILIGMTPVSWLRFVLLDLAAALLWASVFCGLGFGVGGTIRSVLGHLDLHLHLGLAAAIFLCGVLVIWLGLRWRSRHKGEPR
ncbi:DedA family protein [Sedimentitalea todarodis]|uniref:VTT domain-containing protein n=1 Tax=Sedimentitalea todarodis TaxID=1631240 RepID=A0ABU3V8Q5_9RHOB|nr:VTT domain-containing protein [Sedimentitalea todarodis]MDU9002558.1 VTT domain-containing protein [Sedimentitalea todarodis]